MNFNDPFSNGGIPGANPAQDQDLSFDFEMPDEILVPEGQYVAKVSGLDQGETKNGDPKLVWDFMILAPESQVGQIMSMHVGLTDKQFWKLQQILVGIGCIPAGSKSLRFTRIDAINRMCFITVKHREFQGRPTADIDQVLPFTEVGKKHIGGMGGMQPPAPPVQPRQPAPTPQGAPSGNADAQQAAPTSPRPPRRPRRGEEAQAPTPPLASFEEVFPDDVDDEAEDQQADTGE